MTRGCQTLKNARDNQYRRNIQRRHPMDSPLNLVGESNPLSTLPTDILPVFNGNGVMLSEKYLNKFIIIFEIHSIIEYDVMVRVFM